MSIGYHNMTDAELIREAELSDNPLARAIAERLTHQRRMYPPDVVRTPEWSPLWPELPKAS